MCGYTCNHCGMCGKEPVAEIAKMQIPGLCSNCGTLNGPTASVCKGCGELLVAGAQDTTCEQEKDVALA